MNTPGRSQIPTGRRQPARTAPRVPRLNGPVGLSFVVPFLSSSYGYLAGARVPARRPKEELSERSQRRKGWAGQVGT